MSYQVFDQSFREAIWRAYHKKCFYDGRPLLFSMMHIDHLIPEHLLEKPSELAALLARLGMNEFDIRSPLNLVPTCQTCNANKGGMLVVDNQLILFLNQVRERQEKLESILSELRVAKSVDRIIMDIDRAIHLGKFDLNQLIDGLSVQINKLGYIFEKVAQSPAVAYTSKMSFKPIIFMNNTVSAIKEMGKDTDRVIFQLYCLQHGTLLDVRSRSQSGACVLSFSNIRIYYKEYSEKIYVLSVSRKSPNRKIPT